VHLAADAAEPDVVIGRPDGDRGDPVLEGAGDLLGTLVVVEAGAGLLR
jgi:hypothetical protein